MAGSGVVFYALFGLGWLLAGVGHFGGTATGAAGALGLAIALILLLTARRRTSQWADGESRPLPPRTRRHFLQINVLQWFLIAVVVAGCGAAGLPVLIMPLIAVVVGLHFLPLARVFAEERLAVPGVVLTALGVAGLLARAAGASPGFVFTLVGVGCALTLWSTAVWSLAGAGPAENGNQPPATE